MRRHVLFGWGVIGVFVVGGLLAAANSHVDSATIAHGTVGVESNRKSISHLEGGVISGILVREGDRVSKGQPLMRLNETRARASLDLLSNRRDALLAKKARLTSSRNGTETISFPDTLLDRAASPLVLDLMQAELDVLETTRRDLAQEDRVLLERISNKAAAIRGFTARRDATARQVALLSEERQMMADLLKDGLIARNRLLSVERRLAETQGEQASLAADIARTRDEIAEIEMERKLVLDRHQSEVSTELAGVVERLAETDERIRAAADVLERSVLRSPEDGRILALRHHTVGGVVQAGEPVLDIVPDHDRHVVELRIDPNDINSVYLGQTARVRLSALNARTTPLLMGEVINISADRLVDPDTGASYFTGRVIPMTGDTAAAMSDLKPGMQAEVFLINASRTILDYLIEPLFRASERAVREL